MAAVNNSASTSGSRTTPSPLNANGIRSKTTGLIPTNHVTTREGTTVRARIDPTLTVDDVVRQLCVNLKVTELSTNFALRDRDTEELVTNENLRKKIKNKAHLKSVLSSNNTRSTDDVVQGLSIRQQSKQRASSKS